MDPREYDWQMMGGLASQGDYVPTPMSQFLGNTAQGVVDLAKRPAQTMAENPYPPGSEEAQFYEDQRRSNTYRIAPEAAMNLTGTGTPFAVRGGLGVAGGKPPVAPGALAAVDEYRPPFYSAVEQAVQGAKQNAAPGQQWAGFLRNQPGVKQEEVQALGLGKLFEQPFASKEAVLGEIAANRVNVGEVYKGARSLPSAQEAQELAGLEQRFVNKDMTLNAQDADRLTELKMKRDQLPDAFQPTKFSQYTLPGGENYREMLLTLPNKVPEEHRAAIAMMDEPARRELAAKYPEQMGFQSPHYDEPNILAHVRYNDRVIDGKKTLFVEEVQSDWHQKGKREGYSAGQTVSDEEAKAISDKIPGSRGAQHLSINDREKALASGHISQAEHDRLNTWANEYSGIRTGIPDAPFKTTWPELAMKRIIREAAEKGYDKVAWTPGSVQAERYDLSKQINALKVQRLATREGDLYEVFATPKNGEQIRLGAKTKDELPDIVGKEMAQRIANNAEHHQNYTGLDLKVGGEGMKGFYDEILPATVNKLVKKHGGRVDEGTLPMMKSGEKLPFADMLREAGVSSEEWMAMTPASRHAKLAEIGKAQKVHTLDITPQLRAQAMKGFPLFTAGGVAATGVISDLARQDEYR